MESMSPQQQVNISQTHSSSSLTDEAKTCAQMEKRRTKALSCRRQSAPSLVISKALTRSRTISRDNCSSPVSPDTCLLVQSYLNPSRMFISHAYAQLKTGLQTQERHLFLFTDILLVSKAKSSTNFKLKALARVCEMWTANCMEEVCEGSTSLDKSFVMGWPTCNCVATFSSVGLKEKWLSLIKSRIIEEKEKDNPKTIPLKVYAKDMGHLSYKTIAVSNSDSANEVIRLALQQFGVVGSAKDFQLWVSSRKDNAPYPLIGHEFPFSIQMSHIREPLDETTIKDDQEVIPPEKQMELLLEKLQSDSQCQFILRPSRVAVGHSFVVDPDQKPFKRRRSLINWAFWRGSSNQLDDPPQSPNPDRLFGLPLSMVCTDNSLPQPILDMLVFLFQEGPFTRGIFRRSAGAKACRELRDKLDSGIQVIPMSRHSIFVIAAVFKDFLRSIPGSLLLSDLYEKWMAIVDLSDEADDNQLKAIQGLSDSLPPENILLLKHVLAVLYKIQLHAQDNQMNAFNLAICIAPSMLSSPTPSSPEMEGEGTKKVCDLARIMIENCMAIMGDVTALFDGFPQRCGTDCHGSDVSSYQMTDSSYDSLENELNDDSGSPFQPMQRKRGKPDSRSCDSVLTLSDCDLDQTDTDPDNTLKTHLLLPRLTHPVKMTPAVSLSSPQEVPTIPKGVRQLRRSSEPAIWNSASSLSKYLESRGHRKGSYDCVTHPARCDMDEMFVKHLNSLKLEKHLCDKDQSEKIIIRRFKPPPLRLDSSCTNLCSPAASPTRSSVSSLDSSFSQHSVDFAKPCPLHVGSFKASVKSSPRSPGPTIPSPRESSPKEKFDWGQLRSSHGLHPNTWLKREHRLSLSKDKCDLDDKDIGEPLPNAEIVTKKGHSKDSRVQEPGIPSARTRSTSPTCSEENPLETQHCSTLTVKELRELHNQAYSQHNTALGRRYIGRSTHGTSGGDSSSLPKSVFYGQNVRSLVLCRKKSHSLTPDEDKSSGGLSFKRRASEPEETCLGLDKDSVKKLERIHRQAIVRQGQFKVTEVEQHAKACNPRFLLSPAATKTVKDYFFQQGDEDSQSNLMKSQEVALAIVHGKREWMRRCSDTQLEDLEKMVFAEESYV